MAFTLGWYEVINLASSLSLLPPWAVSVWHVALTVLPAVVVGGWQSELAHAAATVVPEVYGDARDRVRTGHKASAAKVGATCCCWDLYVMHTRRDKGLG